MKTKYTILILLVAVVLIVLGFGIYKFNFTNDDIHNQNQTQISAHDGTYKIDGVSVTLKNGISEVAAAPGSASKVVTKYFGNDYKGDLDGDGTDDNAFLITQNSGGSGTFYYVVAILNKVNGSKVGTDAVLLGDRIAPQSMSIDKNNVLVVNYADRKTGESFDIAPSVGKSMYLKIDQTTDTFGVVVKNFEGEADPTKMTLNMKNWIWDKSDKFVLSFKTDKTFSVKTDCNSVGGEYILNGKKLSFVKMISTKMYCENSQEQVFTKYLSDVESYSFNSKGWLTFNLKASSGTMIFK
jgi:heat shock protein HslJ